MKNEEVKGLLDQVSPSFCLAKWLQVSLNLPVGLTQSCYHPPAHKVSLEKLSSDPLSLHNTELKIEERRQMKQGLRPSGCSYCWKTEDLPGRQVSDRIYRSGESWAMTSLSEVASQPHDYPVQPRYVEVNFNHACNFKCSYCSPHISSSWAKESKQFGPFLTKVPHNDYQYFKDQGLLPEMDADKNPYIKAFWNWWPSLYSNLKVFRMTGGEPLIDSNTYRVLDWIDNHPNPELELAITSNMCPPKSQFDKFLEKIISLTEQNKIKRFFLFASIDAWEERAEYIRNGLDFQMFWENVNRYLTEVKSGHLSFIITMNALNLSSVKQLLEGYLALQKKYNDQTNRIFFDTPLLQSPEWMSLKVLDKAELEPLKSALGFMQENTQGAGEVIGFRKTHIERFERIVAEATQFSDVQMRKELMADFHRFFSEHDRRRGTNFLKTFPELSEFWDKAGAAISE